MGDVLDIVCALAGSRTAGAFINQAMEELASAVAGTLVSFNRMDLHSRTASVALRPYRAEHETAIHGVARLLEEHPFYRWYRTQPDWSPVRISDVVPWREFRDSRLLVEVLRPAGACHAILVMLAPPVAGEWTYFMINRADPDFTEASRLEHPPRLATTGPVAQPHGIAYGRWRFLVLLTVAWI